MIKEYELDGYLVKEWQENGQIIVERWKDGERKGREETPIPSNVPVVEVYQPTNAEVYDSTITLMDVLATMYEGMIEKGTV